MISSSSSSVAVIYYSFFKMCCIKNITLLVIVSLVIFCYFFWDKIGIIMSVFEIDYKFDHKGIDKSWNVLFVIYIICFVSILVLCVILKNHKNALHFLYLWILLTLIIEISLSISISLLLEQFIEIILALILKIQSKYYTNTITRKIWNSIQYNFKCCGYDDIETWKSLYKLVYEKSQIPFVLPQSCCISNNICYLYEKLQFIEYEGQPEQVQDTTNPPAQYYAEVCKTKLKENLFHACIIIVRGLAGLAIAKILAVLFSNYYNENLQKALLICPTTREDKTEPKPCKNRQKCSDIPLEVL